MAALPGAKIGNRNGLDITHVKRLVGLGRSNNLARVIIQANGLIDKGARLMSLLGDMLGNGAKVAMTDNSMEFIRDIYGAELFRVPASSTKILNLGSAYLPLADLSRWDLSDTDLTNIDLNGACLREARLAGARLSDASLRGADLSMADFRFADLFEASLDGATAQRAEFDGSFLGDASLRNADLTYASLEGCILIGTNLSGALLNYANLRASNLVGADLRDAEMDGIMLRGALFNTDGVHLVTQWPSGFDPFKYGAIECQWDFMRDPYAIWQSAREIR